VNHNQTKQHDDDERTRSDDDDDDDDEPLIGALWRLIGARGCAPGRTAG